MKPGFDGNFTRLEPVTTEENSERRATVRNITRDQIAILARAGTLSMQEAEAGYLLQRLRERASVGPLRAQEFERAYQDTDVVKGRDSHIGDPAAAAFRKLTKIRERMGAMNWALVEAVALENRTGPEIVKRFPRHSARTIGPAIGYAFEELVNVIGRG